METIRNKLEIEKEIIKTESKIKKKKELQKKFNKK